MTDKLINLQKKINIKFKNLNNLKKSITHKSFDPLNNYKKLEGWRLHTDRKDHLWAGFWVL